MSISISNSLCKFSKARMGVLPIFLFSKRKILLCFAIHSKRWPVLVSEDKGATRTEKFQINLQKCWMPLLISKLPWLFTALTTLGSSWFCPSWSRSSLRQWRSWGKLRFVTQTYTFLGWVIVDISPKGRTPHTHS